MLNHPMCPCGKGMRLAEPDPGLSGQLRFFAGSDFRNVNDVVWACTRCGRWQELDETEVDELLG